MNSSDLKQLVEEDLEELLIAKSDRLKKASEKTFIDGLDEVSGLLSRFDPAPSPLLNALDQKGQDFVTYFYAAYSDTENMDKSLLIYRTVKNLVRYILLMDRYYEVGNRRYMRIAKGLIQTVKKQHERDGCHLSYSIDFAIKQFWPFWDYEQSIKDRMTKGYHFGAKELRHHNLFKSSDAPIIYCNVLDSELPNFNPNVARIIHYNQALQDIQDDFEDIEEDVLDLMPNVFVMAASESISISRLLKNHEHARKLIISKGCVDPIISLVEEYNRFIKETPVPPAFAFLKYLGREYADKLLKTLGSS